MAESVPTCGLGQMLGKIAEMKSKSKWGWICDTNGNVATFMKYKAQYMPACLWIPKGKDGVHMDEEKMAAKYISSLCGGGVMCFDLDALHGTKDLTIDTFLREDWFANIQDKAKFLNSDNLSAIGKKYQSILDA
jgi:hypothetical protein